MVGKHESKKGGYVMAVTKVTARISDNLENLQKNQEDIYSGNLTAPRESGDYDVEINAYDDAGNVSVANKEIEVTKWKTPNVNWLPTDRFNIEDFNRIKNNLEYLHERAVQLYLPFGISDMGDDILVYTPYWDVDKFNAFERNLEEINKHIYIQDFGASQTFYPNGVFIQYNELNRIENATLSMKILLDNQAAGVRKLPFKLGRYREVRV